MLSVYKSPPEVALTRPAPKEEMVVEPLAVNLVSVVVAKVEVPVTDKVPEKEGEEETAIVEVPEKTILLPALKNEIGEL